MEILQTASAAMAPCSASPDDTESGPVDRPDHELLRLFQQSADAEAFTQLVQRHYGMVFAMAQRMLGCPHAAEDVVQATFLVLARDARRIRKRHSLVSWLYGVAYRISVRAIRQRARITVSTMEDEVMVAADPLEKLNAQFEQGIVFEELHGLPESTRAPLVLRYLQGKTNQQIARELKLSETAVEGRLKRGRKQLRLRLARKGVTYALGVGILSLVQREALASELPRVVSKTLATALGAPNGVETPLETDPRYEITRMAEEEIFRMATTKLAGIAAITGVAMGVLAAGWAMAGDGFGLQDSTQDSGNAQGVEIGSQADSTATDTASVSLFSHPQETTSAADTFDSLTSDPPSSTSTDASATQASLSERRRSVEHYSIESMPVNELQILENLQRAGRFDYVDTPLRDVVEEIASHYKMQMMIDTQAIIDDGLAGADALITFRSSDMALENALELMLDKLQLTTVIKNEVLLVTTRDVAENRLDTRVYRWTSGEWPIDNEILMQTILHSVEPDSWQENGGIGTMALVTDGLVISASQHVHRQINKLLGQFRLLYGTPQEDR